MIVNGHIFDAMTGQALPGATVGILNPVGQYTGGGTIANDNGNFSLSADPETRLKITYVGYSPVTVSASQAAQFPISLFVDNNLPEVVVTAPKPDNMDNSVQTGPNGPTQSDIKKTALLFGVLLLAGIVITNKNGKKR